MEPAVAPGSACAIAGAAPLASKDAAVMPLPFKKARRAGSGCFMGELLRLRMLSQARMICFPTSMPRLKPAIPALLLIAALYAQPAPQYNVSVSADVMIPMRDGVKLATDIYRPSVNGAPSGEKLPALLMRTPYNKTIRARAFAEYFTGHGYVVVVQDVRGRYKSEGHWRPLRDDGADGFDTAQWIGQQPWCSGAIGTLGTSYEGGTQHALAIAGAPFVKSMIPLFSMSDVSRYGMLHNGAFELRWFNWVFSLGDPGGNPNLVAATRAASNPDAAPALADLVNHVRDYVIALPLRAGTTPLKFAPDYESFLVDALSGDEKLMKDMGIDVVDHAREYKDAPVYHVTGWYDSWSLQVANLNYVALRKSKKSPQRLIVGPWVHSRPNISYA